jgi:hypothetical protein
MRKCSRRRKMIKWLGRTLVYSPVYLALCTTQKEFHAELKRLGVPKEPFIHGSGDATTSKYVSKEGKHCAIITIRKRKKTKRSQIDALLVHEAVHVWQWVKEILGEHEPSKEFEAYSIQSISQELIEAYHDE